MQGWVTGRGSGASQGGEDSSAKGARRAGSHSATETPVFVYVAQPSYLPPVLTPHSSCFKSLLLIFLFTLASAPPGPVVFGVLVLFQWRLRGGGDTGGGGGGAFLRVKQRAHTYFVIQLLLTCALFTFKC